MVDSSIIMAGMDEEDLLLKLCDIEKSDKQAIELKKTKYNPRDPAAAQTASSFTAAFSNLKKSKFYEEPAAVKASTSEAGNSTSAGGAQSACSTSGVPIAASASGVPIAASTSGVPLAPGAQRLTRSGALLVSPRQRGNPLLKAISSVPWEFDDEIVPDYVMGVTTCALFLSLRYHNLNPDYIHERLKVLGKKFVLRVLLVQVDLSDPAHQIKHLNRLCILADLTLMLAGSPEEAGRILETYKMFENKPPELIMERKEEGIHTKVQNALTTVRSVNKTDASTLLKTFGSLETILKTNVSELELCAGFGAQKARRLETVLHQPFLRRS